MRKLQRYARLMLLALALFMASHAGAQDFGKVCRIENGKLVFRIDLRWTRDQVREFSGLFDLDTTRIFNLMDGMPDSLLLAEGWSWKRIGDRAAELSRPIAETAGEGTGAADILFLLDDDWMAGAASQAAQPAYGVNRLREEGTLTQSDSLIRFLLPGYDGAARVFLSGTFNDWSTTRLPAERTPDGWSVSLTLKPGKYQYKYIIDGRWTQDPGNRLRENDLNGGWNSVLYVNNFRFRLEGYPQAKKVVVAGSFNGFNPDELVMDRAGGGWELNLFLHPGTHAYKFIADGNWFTDPANPVQRPDGRGNINSFLSIGDTTWFRLDGYASTRKVMLAGSFNAWNGAELEMEKTDTGWQIPYVLPPGNYQYKFIADGNWMTDPANPYRVGSDPRGNSLISVGANHRFRLEGHAGAKEVNVSGSFNGWDRRGFPMVRDGGGWVLPLFLSPGKHTYKYIIDGVWIIDPGNPLWEENEYGTGNSVLWIERSQ